MDSFYNWLIIMVEKDFNELKFNSCQDFLDEYQNLIKSLLEKPKSIKHDLDINNLMLIQLDG
ncbi:MAG: hypothetical protein F8N39_19675 [Clostridiaceae bacterium]|nr:hypothetical protein [Clostridiaceae bacterium]